MIIGGIVLCGGRSRRMGRPKAWLPFAGELMLPRVVRLLGEVVAPLVVVAAPGQDVPPLPSDIVVVRDDVEGRGPLQGLAAGLRALTGRAEAAYLSSCDVPFLRPPFVLRLIELLGDHALCVPDAAGYRQPLAALYRLTVAPTVDRLLAGGRLRPGGSVRRGGHTVCWGGGTGASRSPPADTAEPQHAGGVRGGAARG